MYVYVGNIYVGKILAKTNIHPEWFIDISSCVSWRVVNQE